MTLFKGLLPITAAAVLVSAGLSWAAVDTQALVSDLQAQGYTQIEVKSGVSQIKVEAIRGTEKVEVVYDKTTGAVLKSETEAVAAGDDIAPGVSFDTRDDDFADAGRRGSDDADDSADDSNGRSDDDNDDGSGDDSGRDRDDDRDEDDDSGDDRGDDHGGDRGGDSDDD